MTAFAFDAGEQLSEHTALFDAMVIDLDGEADIAIGGKVNRVKPGEMIIMPAGRAPRPEGRDAVQDAPGHDQEAGVKTTAPRHPSDQRRRLLPGDHPGPVPGARRRSDGPTSSPRTGSGAPALWPSPCGGRSASRPSSRASGPSKGTPVDCVYFALQKFLPRRPDLIISGMNPGPNLGQQDINYSGHRRPGPSRGPFTASPPSPSRCCPTRRGRFDLKSAADIVRTIAADVLAHGLPPGTALNVNIPPAARKGVKITRLGWKFYDPEIIEKTDPRELDLLLDRHGDAAPRRRRRDRTSWPPTTATSP
ncbi:MAG: hypothetical protein MZV70_29455 [Desulfobacterales bacterium]|nr:hypothetical protein [Desulfobacterales bacterium]